MTKAADWDDKIHEGKSAVKTVDALRAKRPKPNGAAVHSTPFKTLSTFFGEYMPLANIIDPLIHSGSIITLTGRTGHGKTGLLVSAAFAIATGRAEIIGRPIEPGRVAYIAAENPDDLRKRMMVAAFRHNINPAAIAERLVILDQRKSPEKLRDDLVAECEARGPLQLITADTLAALFDGRDVNDNVQVGEFIRRMRAWTTIPGRPGVLIAAHPKKDATRDQLVPYGGGAALNEVDGNLACWMEGAIMEVFQQGKFRGSEFDPITFKFERLGSPDVLDVKGRQVEIPVCVPVTVDALENRAAETAYRNKIVLQAIAEDPAHTARGLVDKKLIGSTGTYDRATKALAKRGYIKKGVDDRWRLTPKGKREVEGIAK